MLGTFLWAFLQFSTEVPPGWANPAWSFVEADGRIAVDPSFGRHVLTRLMAYAMVFWIALRAAMDDKRAIAFIKAVAIWSFLLALYGILVMLSGQDWLAGSRAPNNLSSTFVNRNSYATYAGFGLAANLAVVWLKVEGAVIDAGSRRAKFRNLLEALVRWGWLYALGALVVASALMLTVSRAGIVSGAVGVFVFILALRLRRSSGSGATFWPLAAAVGAVAIYAGTIGLESFLIRTVSLSNEQLRFLAYPRILEAMADYPLLGTGLGGFHDTFRAYYTADLGRYEWDMAHSTYLENVLELGIVAAVLFYAALAIIAWRILRGTRERRRYVAVPAFALAVAGIGGLHSLVDFSLQMPATAALFAFVLGLGWSQSFRQRDRLKPDDD
jgi:O-antigen ligase